MPNRIVREAILTSERVDALSAEAEVFYRRVLNVVDDFGRGDARPAVLIATCYPLRAGVMPQAKVEHLLGECCAGDKPLIIAYEVGGKRFIEVQDFRQQLRSARSRFPAPSDADAERLRSTCATDAERMRSNCAAGELRLRTYSESETESETHAHANAHVGAANPGLPPVDHSPFDPAGGEGAIAEWALSPETPNADAQRNNDAQVREQWFEEFWTKYSRWCSRDRKRARTAFHRSVKSRALFERILVAIERQSPEMMGRPADKRPYAATWLNGERWADGEVDHQPEQQSPAPAYRETPDGFGRFAPMGGPEVTRA